MSWGGIMTNSIYKIENTREQFITLPNEPFTAILHFSRKLCGKKIFLRPEKVDKNENQIPQIEGIVDVHKASTMMIKVPNAEYFQKNATYVIVVHFDKELGGTPFVITPISGRDYEYNPFEYFAQRSLNWDSET